MSGSISAELSAAQAQGQAASQVLQVRQKFNGDILAAGQKRGEEVDRAMLASLTSELDKAIADAKILGDQIAMAVAGMGMAVAASGYLNSNDVDDAKKGVKDRVAGTATQPGLLSSPDPQSTAVKNGVASVMSGQELTDANKAIAAQKTKMTDEDPNFANLPRGEQDQKAMEALGNAGTKPFAVEGVIGTKLDPNMAQRIQVGNALQGQMQIMQMQGSPLTGDALKNAAFRELAKHPPDAERFAAAEFIGRQSDPTKFKGSTPEETMNKAVAGMREEIGKDIEAEHKNSINPFKGTLNGEDFRTRTQQRLAEQPSFTSAVLNAAPADSALSVAFTKETNDRVKEVKDAGHQKRFGSVDKAMMDAMGAIAQIQAQMMAHEAERRKATRLMSANSIAAANLQG